MKSEDDLATVLSEFARTMMSDFPIQTVLDRLVRRIVDILPIDAAAISLMSLNTDPRIIAGSDASATRYEHLQTVLGEGPCIAAYESNQQISIADLAEDDRFPRYTRQALADGLRAVFTFPFAPCVIGAVALEQAMDRAGSCSRGSPVCRRGLGGSRAQLVREPDRRPLVRDRVARPGLLQCRRGGGTRGCRC